MPSKETASLSDRFSSLYEELSTAAAELNAASDELGKPVAALNFVLKDLNLGIATAVKFDGEENPQTGYYWTHSVGYSKAGGKWGISISNENGFLHDPDSANSESWPFNEAPRSLRIGAIEKLPELLVKLIQATKDTAARVKAGTAEAKKLADTIKTVATTRK